MNAQISITVANGHLGAYVARPDKLPAPSVVVLHEIFGVNADMRKTCDELAAHEFTAVCPDLFWRLEPGTDLNSWSEAAWTKGLSLNAAFDRNTGVLDIAATARAASRLEGASGKIGVMGFCIGGLMTFLTAARET